MKTKTWKKFDNGCVKGIEFKQGDFTASINERGKYDTYFYGHYHYKKNGIHVSMTPQRIYVDTLSKAKKYMEEHFEEFIKSCDYKFLDKTANGYYCLDCGRFSEKCQMGWGVVYVHPHGNESNECWLVKSHYDGCRGWD